MSANMATTQNFMSPHVVISDEVAAYKPPYGPRGERDEYTRL